MSHVGRARKPGFLVQGVRVVYEAVGRVELENQVVDPAIQNSNTPQFRGGRLAVPSTEDHRFPEDLALEAVRQFMEDHGQVPTAVLWAAAGLSPSEKTIRRR